MTLDGLARRVHYSKSHLSKVERGKQQSTHELAARCDQVLAAEGGLASLVPRPARPRHQSRPIPRRQTETDTDDRDEEWLVHLSQDGESWFRPVGRRAFMAAGGAVSVTALTGFRLGTPHPVTEATGTSILTTSRQLLEQQRRLGQSAGPKVVLPTLITQAHTLRQLGQQAGPRTRPDLLQLSSRYAEYVGWLFQETGDNEAALWWTRQAVELAAAGGDSDLAAYALVRRALITFYRGEADETIALAQRAQGAHLPPRIRGLAAQQEAQGHALAGDTRACLRSLDEARDHFSQHSPDPTAPVIGTMNLTDPVGMITGWCLYDLGQPQRAASEFDRQMKQVPAGAVRSQARYGMRQALAYAAAGEVRHACALARPLLEATVAVDSATTATDIRALERLLRRYQRDPAVRDLAPELASALHPFTT